LSALDLGSQRRIAVFAENANSTALANLGGLIAGASVVPINFHLNTEELAYILNDSESRILFVGPETLERGLAAAELSNIHTVIAWGVNRGLNYLHWEEWLQNADASEPDVSLKPLPNLLYTSGTTGRPKGTNLPPTMFAGGDTIAEHLSLLAEKATTKGPMLVVGPLYHTGPLSGARLLAAGVPAVVLGKFDAELTLAAIDEYKTTTSVMVPTHFVRLLNLPKATRDKYDMSSIELISHTGAKCPVEVKRAMIEWWGPKFLDAYGASEVGTTCMILADEWLKHPGSVGRSIPPFTAMILDEENNVLAPNIEGRLYFKDATGRGVVYNNDPEKSAAAHIAPGIFTLGEIAYMDEDGYVYITDRFSDMIVSGGVNIYPAEAEQIIIEHESVLDIACIGIPHSEMGEELKALCIPVEGQEPDAVEILNWCRERLSHYKCPRTLDFVDDLGRNTMGKINKRKLRARFWAED
jgi:long-chain acyl-CoA synthetase